MYAPIRPLIPLLVATPLLGITLGSCKSLNTDLGRNVYERELEDTFEDTPGAVIATTAENRMVVFRANSFVAEPPASDADGERSQGVQFLREATYRLAEARANSVEAMIALKNAGVSEAVILATVPSAADWTDMFLETLALSHETTVAEFDLWEDEDYWFDEDSWDEENEWEFAESKSTQWDWNESCEDDFSCPPEKVGGAESECEEEQGCDDDQGCETEQGCDDDQGCETEQGCDDDQGCETEQGCDAAQGCETEQGCDDDQGCETEQGCDDAPCCEDEASECHSEQSFSFAVEVAAGEQVNLAPSALLLAQGDGSLQLVSAVSATGTALDIPKVVSSAGVPAPVKPLALATTPPAPVAVATKTEVAPTPKPTQDRFTGTADGLDEKGQLAIRYFDDSRKGERVAVTVRCLDAQDGDGAALENEYSILLSPVTGIGTKSIPIPASWGFVKLSSPGSKAHYAAFF